MTHGKPEISIRAPGRVCFLGEHQDYLGLEVISGALTLGITLTATPAATPAQMDIRLHQTGEHRILSTREPVHPPASRDYLQSGLNVFLRNGAGFSRGWRIDIDGNLPIGKGLSSSSALCTGWAALLAAIADDPVPLSPVEMAQQAYRMEVQEFNEPGGMQDHLASAVGGLIHMDFRDDPSAVPVIRHLNPDVPGLLLVDSGTVKDTLGMIQRIRRTVEQQAAALWGHGAPMLSKRRLDDVPDDVPGDTPDDIAVIRPGSGSARAALRATLINRDIVREALPMLQSGGTVPAGKLAALINRHHGALRDGIGSSAPALDALIRWARDRGAAAGKVIGSGGGGCVLLYCPESPETLMDALIRRGCDCRPVVFGPGVARM